MRWTRLILTTCLISACEGQGPRVVTTASTISSPTEVVTVPMTTTTEEVVVEPTKTTEAQIPTSIPHPTPTAASRSRESLNWAALRQCENGGSYVSKPGDYYRGAYQFDYGTWESVGGSGDPADAPPEEQDERAMELYLARGTSPWPRCGGRLFS